MTNHRTTAHRIRRIRYALAVFTDRRDSGPSPRPNDPDDLEAALTDLIADLLHYARLRGFDADVVAENAHRHFDAERHEAWSKPTRTP